MLKNKLIIVLVGGVSNEKDVSLKTGKSVYNVLKEAGYQVSEYNFDGNLISLINYLSSFEKKDLVVFNCLHGKFGEDGRIQGVLDLLNIAYTHSNFLASAIMMDKNITKVIASSIGINVPKSILINAEEYSANKTTIDVIYPLIVKPNTDGSSFGLFIVNNKQDLEHAISSSSGNILLEQYIQGKEYTVGVLNGKALAITEIITHNELYDFEAKYSPNMSTHIIPAKLSSEISNTLLEHSEKLYKFLQASGAIRIEYIITSNNQIYLLEANSLPGLTETSLLPEQANFAGISFLDLCLQMLQNAKYYL